MTERKIPSDDLTLPQYEPLQIRNLKTAMSSVAMLEILRGKWPYLKRSGSILTDFKVVRIYPRKGREFLFVYEIRLLDDAGERVEHLFGELVGAEAEKRYEELQEKLKKTRRKQFSRTKQTDVLSCIPELGLIIRFSGIDEKLNGMRMIYKPSAFIPILERCLPLNGEKVSGCEVKVLRHRLGKRCIFRVHFNSSESVTGKKTGHSIIGKVYPNRGDRGERVFSVMRGLWENGFSDRSVDGIRIPKPLLYLPDIQMLLMEDVPGSYWDSLNLQGIEPSIGAAGKTLAKLHRSSFKVPGRHTVDDEMELLRDHWIIITSQVYPELKASLENALSKVRNALEKCRSFVPQLVHRDYYEKQVLVNGPQSILIDFDTLCLSDPAIDVGNFLAHIKLAGLQNPGNVQLLEEVFLSSYNTKISREFSSRIEAYTSSSLLRLACLYSLWPKWRHLVKPLINGVP